MRIFVIQGCVTRACYIWLLPIIASLFFFSSPGLLAIQLNFTGQGFPGGPGFPGGTVVKNTPANAEDIGSITRLGRFHVLQGS